MPAIKPMWVQHRWNLNGKKHKTVCVLDGTYIVHRDQMCSLVLPMEDYAPCDPPTQWVGVTSQCYLSTTDELIHGGEDRLPVVLAAPLPSGYRFKFSPGKNTIEIEWKRPIE